MFLFVLISANQLFAQESKLYNPDAYAQKDIDQLIQQAGKENKFVLIQAGGNWCSWCIEFARFANADQQIDSLIKKDFLWYHLNWSKENLNKPVFAKLGFPQRFGFPVFIILNSKGERLHTQNSEYLEDGKKSYDKNKVMAFLESWTPKALQPDTYKD